MGSLDVESSLSALQVDPPEAPWGVNVVSRVPGVEIWKLPNQIFFSGKSYR